MKTCTKCKLELPLVQFYSDATKAGGFCSSCKNCKRAAQRRYVRPDASVEALRQYQRSDKAKALRRAYQNTDAQVAARKKKYKEDTDGKKQKDVERGRQQVKDLAPQYVRTLLRRRKSGVPASAAPYSLVQVHTVLLKIKRYLKEIKNEKC